MHDIASVRHARKAAQAGVDGLILVANGAGGHAGTVNPFALMAEVREFFDGTLILSGCLTSGRDVPREVARRLTQAGFKAEPALDGVFATRR